MSARRVSVNAAALLAGRLFGAAVTMVVVALSAHRLDLEQFGLMTSVMAAGFLANSLITFGTDTVVTRAIAAERGDGPGTARAALVLQFAASLVVVAAAFIAWMTGADAAVLVQALALVAMAAVTVCGAVLRGVQRMDQLLIANASGAIMTVLGVFLGFARAEAPWVPIAALALGSTVSAAVSFRFAAPHFHSAPGPARGAGISLISLGREAAPFAIMVVLAAIGAQVGLLLVEFASDQTAGGYGVAVRVNEAARLVPAAAMGAFFPAMLSGLHRTARYRRWLRWLIVYGAATTMVMLLLAEPVNRIVFDNQPDGAALIRILACGLVFTIARLAMSFELIATGRERTVLLSAFAGAAITIVGGLVVVQRFGAQGVAWAQLVGLVTATLLLLGYRSKSAEASTASTI